MGLLAFRCAHCGTHVELDWTEKCIIHLNGLYIRGKYSGCGYVTVNVENRVEEIYLSEFAEHIPYWMCPWHPLNMDETCRCDDIRLVVVDSIWCDRGSRHCYIGPSIDNLTDQQWNDLPRVDIYMNHLTD